jgi:phosphoglycerate-specific signal transduction histidine kinase
VDPIQIQEIFINLISNATEAMEDIGISPLVKVRAAVTGQSEMLVQAIDTVRESLMWKRFSRRL